MKRQRVTNQDHIFMKTQNQNIQLQHSNIVSDSKTIQILIRNSDRQKQMKKEQQPDILSNSLTQQKLPSNMKEFLKQKRLVTEISLNKSKKNFQIQNAQQKFQFKPNLTNESILETQQPNPQLYKTPKKRTSKKSIKQHPPSINPEIPHICSICEGNIQIKNIENPVFHCSHTFCSDCTKNYLIYKINRFQQIYCPNQNCKGVLNEKSHFYTHKIPLKQRKKYQRIHNFYQVHNSNELQKICPKQDCEGILQIDPNQLSITCKICKVQFCSKCLTPPHPGQCEDFQTIFLKQNFHLVKCQRCKNFIEKQEGCSHITCKCGYEFCEKCKLPWQKRHICKYTILNAASQGWGGCDWGITKRDHICFLLKIPLKTILIILCASFWTVFSFLGVPLNLIIGFYWLYLLLVKPTVDMIKNQSKFWKILIWLILFPFLMVGKICKGREHLLAHLDWLFPEIPNSFRWIIRL